MAKKKAKALVAGKNDLPPKKLNVTKEFMIQYLEKWGKLEDVEWYERVLKENVSPFHSNLNGETYDIPNWKSVRAAFLKRFFPNAFPRTPAAQKTQATYEQRLAALKAAKAKESEKAEAETGKKK